MAPLVVEGDTLGQKHQNYNKLVNEAIKNNTKQEITALNYDDTDLDNLFKIDIACNNRDVGYILEVLKCADMLYVSRVIKQSTWLITDQQYAHVINSEYLHNELYPQMTSKAFNKLILHVRLSLKDEKRVEEFFNYYKQKDLKKALKWLPQCSVSFVENIIQIHADNIPKQLMKRLCEKSITFLQIFCRSYKSYYKRQILESTMFVLNTNVEQYLELIEASETYDIPEFGPKYTKKILDEKRERVMQNLEKYVNFLDVSTFAKYLKKEDVKSFILTHIKNKNLRSWFVFNKMKYFIKRLPVDERFDFVKKVFVDKDVEDVSLEDEAWDDVVAYCSPPIRGNGPSSKRIYSWYIYAPFTRAFGDLKQFIRNESNPSERISILRVMLTCAGKDIKNVSILLKYYRENHINEPFKFKIQFVNVLLSNINTHRLDKETWGYLKDIFNSMEVYSISDKCVQSCVKSIIEYSVIHSEDIPHIIENKFVFETLKSRNKFNELEKEKIFNYLYSYIISKMKNTNENEKEFNEAVDNVENVLKLLDDWNKELKDYPLILEKIVELIIVKKENSWCGDLSQLYNMKKSWRKLLFAQSITLNLNQETCINALKHDPKLLVLYRKEINELCLNNNMHFDRFLKKLRIYWCQSLSNSFRITYMESLNQQISHKAMIRGLCLLLTQKELVNFIEKYTPIETKIDWSQHDDLEFSLRKCIATCMHLARPQPTLDVALWYAKGDYLQFILPSLNAILYNISASYICEHITQLLNTPVSLQKHGIRVAFSKLKNDQLKQIFSEIWKSTKNSTIRADIFNQTYLMLCKENDETIISEIWELLNMFIDGLNLDENKKVYLNLSQPENVPLLVRPAFWMKSYEFLKKLPLKANFSCHIDYLTRRMNDIMEFLDNDFVAKIFFEEFDKTFTNQAYRYSYQVALFVLSTRTEKAQSERYKKVLAPIIAKAVISWDKQYDNIYYTRKNLLDILGNMIKEFKNVIKQGMVIPITMYSDVMNQLRSSLSVKENYFLLTNIRLTLSYIKIVNDVLEANKELAIYSGSKDHIRDEELAAKWKHIQTTVAPIFGRECVNYLREDVSIHFSTIYIIFGDILENVIARVDFNEITSLRILKPFLDCEDFIPGYLLVLKVMGYIYDDDAKAVKLEMLNKIRSHPSEEVLMHYCTLTYEKLI